jgi:NADH-quinone oxidoreductase subunit A
MLFTVFTEVYTEFLRIEDFNSSDVLSYCYVVHSSEVGFWELSGFFVLFVFSSLLIFMLFLVNLLLASVTTRSAKNLEQRLAAYECGFEAFDDARMQFDVRYYLIAILFLLFDIEIVFILPWTVCLP